MNRYYEQIDSTYDLTSDLSYYMEPVNETVGSSSLEWFSRTQEYHLMRKAVEALPEISNSSIKKQVKILLSKIHEIILFLIRCKVDLSYIPPLKVSHYDDDSISIDWAFPDFRIGFNIEAKEAESGWHLVSNERLGYNMASGTLATSLDKLIYQLINIILNSM